MKQATFTMVLENARFIVEAEVEEEADGSYSYYNILITNKATGRSYEADELPEGILTTANAVAAANLEG